MAKTQTTPAQPETTEVEKNARVSVSKQNLTDENGVTLRSLYYLKIQIGKEVLTVNTGEKTYESIKKMAG